jgi:hypothetical protein
MPGRLRSRTIPGPQGDLWNDSGSVVITGGQIPRSVSSCQDWTGPGDCFPLGIDSWYSEGALCNRDGTQWSGNHMVDYVADAMQYDTNWQHGAVSGLKSYGQIAAEAAARTNPSRPYVDIPVNILELGDITRTLRTAGGNLIRSAGRDVLRYEFGIKPIVSDLVKLSNFRREVSNRMKEVRRLQGPKGLRRTINADAGSVQFQTGTIYMQSLLASTDAPAVKWDGITNVLVKAHVRWIAGGSLPKISESAEMERLVQRAILGLTFDASTAWEAMPWSWLIDWGTTIGSYFKANRNIIPATLQGVWISQHTRSSFTCPAVPFAYGEGMMSPGKFTRDTKTRTSSIPVLPIAHFPFLNGKQVGILASLSVAR